MVRAFGFIILVLTASIGKATDCRQQARVFVQPQQVIVQQPQFIVQQPQFIVQQPQFIIQAPQLIISQRRYYRQRSFRQFRGAETRVIGSNTSTTVDSRGRPLRVEGQPVRNFFRGFRRR